MEGLQTTLRTLRSGGTSNRLICTTTATAAAIALLAYSRQCYVAWHALGEGGIPHSPRGWLMNILAHLVARRDPRAVPAPYEKSTSSTSNSTSTSTFTLSASDEEKYSAHAKTSFLRLSSPLNGTLPPRAKPRPTVPGTVIPQRQTTETASQSTVSKQNAYLAAIAAANPALFCIKPSGLESPKFTALWLSPSSESPGTVDLEQAKWLPPQARGEIAHVHHEGSTHVCLSLPDAAEVVRKGWGERHRMSGVRGILPWGYVLVYAPREGKEGKEGESEWEVWKAVVVAAARVVARSAGFEGDIVVPE